MQNSHFIKAFALHLVVLICIYYLFFSLGMAKLLPNSTTLIQWDASWYKSIVENGYIFIENQQSNTGFFPLFPYLWKWSKLSALGISILNYTLFATGLFFITKTIKQNISFEKLLFLFSFPSLFFMYVPYSEALFFVLASLFLYANSKKNTTLKLTALFFASLSRPTIFFLLPAILFSELLKTGLSLRTFKSLFPTIITIFIGTFTAFYIVGHNNIWLYSESQINNWNHSFSIPSLPFTTWRGFRILWLDALGLLVTISCFIASLHYIDKWIKEKYSISIDSNKAIALGYLSMTLIYVTFFHLKETSTGQTSLLSLNRYVFCSPFFFYLYLSLSKENIYKNKALTILSLGITLLLLGFPFSKLSSLSHILSFLYFIAWAGIVIMELLPIITKTKIIIYSIYLTNVLLQVYLFQSFLKGNWIG